MRTTFLLFLTISCAVLMCGRAYASLSAPGFQASQTVSNTGGDDQRTSDHTGPADDGKHQEDGKPSDGKKADHHASDKDHPLGRANVIRVNRPQHVANNSDRSASPDAENFRRLGSGSVADARKDALVRNATPSDTFGVRPAGDPRRADPPLSARHRGANPAAINGSANPDHRNVGKIDGTRMHRKQ